MKVFDTQKNKEIDTKNYSGEKPHPKLAYNENRQTSFRRNINFICLRSNGSYFI